MSDDSYSFRRQHYKDRMVAATYDASRFHSLTGRIDDWLDKFSLIRALAFLPRGSSILDLACGTGRITKFLLQRGFHVWGADISEEMLQVARGRLFTLDFFRGVCLADAERLPFADGNFDGVVSVRFLGHVPPHIRTSMLCEMNRISKGYVIVQYPLTHLKVSLPGLKKNLGVKPASVPAVSLEEARTELSAAGLEIQAMFPKLPYVLYSWMIVARKMQ